MRFSRFCHSGAAFVSAVCSVFVYATAVPAMAQGAVSASLGVPQDWSHRHVIHSNPDTLEEAAAKGTLDQWVKNADDPRFVIQLEKKLAKLQKAAADAEDDELTIEGAGARKFALGTNTAVAKGKQTPMPQSEPALDRDWSNVMGGALGAGHVRTYPAKFAFTTSTKSCANDFVVFTTSTAGAASTGTFNSRPGTFTGIPVAGETVTITNVPYNPNQVLILTADASVNTGLKFAVGAGATDAATNLANAIARNGGKVGVTATSSGTVVTVTSVTTAVTNGNLTYAEGLSNFTWGSQTAGTGSAGQPTIFALNQLYADTVANTGCQTATQAVPAVFWSYNTGTASATFAGSTTTNATISATPVYGPLSGSPCTAFVASTNPGACDTTVGTSVTVGNFKAMLNSNIPASTTFRLTVYKNGVPTALTCDITSGKSCSDLNSAHATFLTAGDKVAVQIVKISGTDQLNRAVSFSVTVPLSGPFIAALSPTLSLDGSQVAFIQTANGVATLVLLKWSSASPGTLGVPTAPTQVATTDYRACSAPCMAVLPFAGSVGNTNSSPYVDYRGDELYVGDDTGKLHRFTGVFKGTPARAGAPWPVQVAATTSIMSSPIFNGGSTVYIGSNGPNLTGNRFHWVDTVSGAVTSSGTIGSSSDANGVRDAPILDMSSGKVYAFQGAFTSGGPDVLGNTCPGTCNTVFQFAANFAGGNTGSSVFVGASGTQNDLNRAMNSGAFDNAFYSSGGLSGNLYVCGSRPTVDRQANLWKISISGGSFAARTQGPLLASNDTNDGCSPPTVFKNGSTERLYVSVNNNAAAIGGGGCTQTPGCMYMYTLAPSFGSVFDTTSLSSTINSNVARFINVSTSVALNTSEGAVDTALTSATAGTYKGMTITQSVASPTGDTFTYTLRKNAGDTAITCAITAGNSSCSDTTHESGFLPGDQIDVQVVRTAGAANLTATFRVQLTADVTWNEATPASAGLNATGGTGGIIIDNTVTTGGGSQIYFSTRGAGGTPLGIAVQASQAGLN